MIIASRSRWSGLVEWIFCLFGAILMVVMLAFTVPKMWWPTVTATARECYPVHYQSKGRTGTSTGCTMVWTRDGAEHSVEMSFPEGSIQPGYTIPLAVDGDSAIRPDERREELAMGVGSIGLLVLVAATWLLGWVPGLPPPRWATGEDEPERPSRRRRRR
jgi:hypothetical protein